MDKDENIEEPFAVLGSSPMRRIVGCSAIYFLGGFILVLTLASPPALGWLLLMLGFGGALLFLGEKMRQATGRQVFLFHDRLEDSSGAVLAMLDDIQTVDRGALAFKPANGFILKLSARQPRRWAPGLWWSLGRYVGVGGMVNAGPSKFMAERIAAMVDR